MQTRECSQSAVRPLGLLGCSGDMCSAMPGDAPLQRAGEPLGCAGFISDLRRPTPQASRQGVYRDRRDANKWCGEGEGSVGGGTWAGEKGMWKEGLWTTCGQRILEFGPTEVSRPTSDAPALTSACACLHKA